jgi:glycosyltransferase involved in cell wall biosynthesis
MQTIAVHTNKLLPYSETFIKNHIEGLITFESIVIGSEEERDGLTLNVKDKFIIKRQPFGQLLDAMHKIGITVPSLCDFLINNNTKLIHSHFGQNGYTSIGLAKALAIPHVTTFHGFDISIDDLNFRKIGISHYLFRKNINRLQKNGDLFIAVSDFIKRKLLEKGFDEKRVVTNYLGIDTQYFTPKASVLREKTVICIARHVPYKGHQYLISAFKKVNQFDSGVCLKIVGTGPEMEHLRQLAEDAAINVDFTGRLSVEQVKLELNKAKVYCQPSVRLGNGHEEALALTIVEAQAMGVPAVVFDSGGMPEAIEVNKSGFVVEEKNVDQLAQKIITLFSDENLWSDFSQHARNQVELRHDIVKQTEKLECIYNQLIKDRK